MSKIAEIGNLFVTIGSKFDAEGINSAVNKIDELSEKTKNITEGFKIVGAALTSFAVGGVVVIKNLVDAFSEQESADIRLIEGMKAVGQYTTENYQAMKDFAGQ